LRVRKSLLRLLAATAVFAMVAAACGGDDGDGEPGGDNGDKETVKIAFFGALSGDYKLLVVHGFQGAELAFKQANESGDLPVNVELVPFDTQGSGDVAAPLVDQVVGDDTFVGVIGPAFSGESHAVGDRLDDAGLPFLSQSATDDALAENGWTHWFRGLGNNSDMGAPAGEYIATTLGATTACAVSDGTPYGLGLKDLAVEAMEGAGVTVGLNEDVEPGGEDYSAIVTKIADDGCEALFYGGYSPEAGLIRSQMNDAGLSAVTMVGGDGIKDDTYTSTAGDTGEGTISSCVCADLSASEDPAAQTFIADYQADYGEAPGVYGAEGYDIAQIYIAAMKAGNTSPEDITTFVQELDGFQGLTKSYAFEDNGELAAASKIVFFYEVQSGAWTVLGSSDEVLAG
jgi:branched-chain amino acid transport system substrate-binding protein